jgi:hypothetical protein
MDLLLLVNSITNVLRLLCILLLGCSVLRLYSGILFSRAMFLRTIMALCRR